MRATIGVAILALGILISIWLYLRIRHPEKLDRWGSAILAGGAAIAGGIVTILTLGRARPKRDTDETPVANPRRRELEEIREKYATDYHFDEFQDRADKLEPVPPRGSDLDAELEEFRAGSNELLHGDDPRE